MKVLHLPVTCMPWTIGGKEVFTHGLAAAQRQFGIDAEVAIHQSASAEEPLGTHTFREVPVHVLPAMAGTEVRSAIYSCCPKSIPGFSELLRTTGPEVVHLHDFSVGANLLHLRAARAAGCRVVMTYHSPGQVCTQRSLLYRGSTVCDGHLEAARCNRCRLGVLGVPEFVSRLVGRIGPLGFSIDGRSLVSRALTTLATVRQFEQAWRECIDLVDCFTVHARWCFDLLAGNGVPEAKIFVVRSGWVAAEGGDALPPVRERKAGQPLRIVFVGRADPTKGLQVLIEAVRSLPRAANIEVIILGPYWTEAFGRRLLERTKGDDRFRTPELVPASEMMRRIADADVCVIPSICKETGPLVAFEAFAGGVPVVGSRLGGIAEVVTDGRDGLLFEPGDHRELAAVLARFLREPETLEALQVGVRHPRTIRETAGDTIRIYEGPLPQGPSSDG